jgi:hypothetical protein
MIMMRMHRLVSKNKDRDMVRSMEVQPLTIPGVELYGNC